VEALLTPSVLNELMSEGDYASNIETQRKCLVLSSKLSKLEMVPYCIALFGLLFVFEGLLHVNDCAFMSVLNKPYTGNDYKVLESDPNMRCYTGLHLYLFVHNSLLMMFFLGLTSPLYIVVGDYQRLAKLTSKRCLFRLLERMNPLKWWHSADKVWPGFAGASSQRHMSYFFQTSFLFYQLGVSSIEMLTTYNPHPRFIVDALLSISLLIVSFWKPPVQHPYFLHALRIFTFLLTAYPVCVYVYEMCQQAKDVKAEMDIVTCLTKS